MLRVCACSRLFNTSCSLHLAFHGCKQSYQVVQDFPAHAGYNGWAEANNLIIVYPQTQSNALNPQGLINVLHVAQQARLTSGCWDWWGYNNVNNYDTKAGDQMKAIKGKERIQKLNNTTLT